MAEQMSRREMLGLSAATVGAVTALSTWAQAGTGAPGARASRG